MDLSKYIKKYDFETVHEILEKKSFVYSLNNISKVFARCNSVLIYSFLMYSISKNETVEKHIAICECLLYINPYIFEANSLIYWHVMRAITLSEGKRKIMSWAIEVYGEDPSSPFSIDEMNCFAKNVIEESPDNNIAKAILDTINSRN